ncbi:MAG: aspartyl protease family protein [Myxococcota bacterium]
MSRPRATVIHGLLFPAFGPLVRGRMAGPDGRNASGLVLIDTGATMSGVDRDVARELGLETHGAAEWRAVGGNPAVAALRVGRLALGEDPRQWELDLIELAGLRSQIAGYTLIALLGWDFLDQCRVDLDGPARTFRLELPRH